MSDQTCVFDAYGDFVMTSQPVAAKDAAHHPSPASDRGLFGGLFRVPSAIWGSCAVSADSMDVVLTAPPWTTANSKSPRLEKGDLENVYIASSDAWLASPPVGDHECVALISIPMLKSKDLQGQGVDAVLLGRGADATGLHTADERAAPDQSHSDACASPSGTAASPVGSSNGCVATDSGSRLGRLSSSGQWNEAAPQDEPVRRSMEMWQIPYVGGSGPAEAPWHGTFS